MAQRVRPRDSTRESQRTTRRPPPSRRFQPRFTLGIVYFFGFFFVLSMLLALPALLEAYRELPAGELTDEDLELATQVAQRTVQPRLWMALALALLALGTGIYARVLPGFRRGPS